MISDLTMGAVEYALGGIAARGAARSNNVANVNTPGYVARTVDFESTLRAALDRRDAAAAPPPAATVAPGVPNEQGNTVSLERELIAGYKDGVLYEAMVHGFNYKVDVVRTAIGRR